MCADLKTLRMVLAPQGMFMLFFWRDFDAAHGSAALKVTSKDNWRTLLLACCVRQPSELELPCQQNIVWCSAVWCCLLFLYVDDVYLLYGEFAQCSPLGMP